MLQSYHFPRSTPERLGLLSGSIRDFLDAVEDNGIEMHSFMIVRHGHIAAEGAWAPYQLDNPHILFSLSKSFSATAIGFAVQEGLLTVDDLLITLFPEYVTEEIAVNMSALSIRHVLTMSTGHDVDTGIVQRRQPDGDWVKAFFDTPIVHPPGSYFLYNSGGSYMLSAIIQKVTGQTLVDYLKPRLFEPLGIDYALWETCPKGASEGASGLHMKTDAIARFGQLYLQKGMWNGRRILSEEWVEEATTSQVSNNPHNEGVGDWKSGYGYQMWRCRYEGAYRGDGAFGQFCVVIPDKDVVVAITSGTNQMGKISDLIWEHLLTSVIADEPLEREETSQESQSLKQHIAKLEYSPPRMKPDSPEAMRISGKSYALEPNVKGARRVSFVFEEKACLFRLWDDRGEHEIRMGHGEWIIGDTLATEDEWVAPVEVPWKLAASCTWQDDHTLVMTWRFIETPFTNTVICQFNVERLKLHFTRDLTFEPYNIPAINGSSIET